MLDCVMGTTTTFLLAAMMGTVLPFSRLATSTTGVLVERDAEPKDTSQERETNQEGRVSHNDGHLCTPFAQRIVLSTQHAFLW